MKKFIILLFLTSFLFAQELKKEQSKKEPKVEKGTIKVKVVLQHANTVGPINECRVFIGENISLNKEDLREIRPVILLPIRKGWMYLNGKAKEMKRTNTEGIVSFENLPFGKYKIIAAWWKEEAQIQEVNLNKEEIEVVFKFIKQ